ncbi:MAG: riboflavin synthase [Terriglobales bacterium]
MFTGIVQAVGRVRKLEQSGNGARLEVSAPATMLRRLRRGASIAVNGCCLTVVSKRGGAFAADLSEETLARTGLGSYRAGAHVNLEPSLRLGDELGGHLLQGHVQGTATLLEFRKLAGGGGWWLSLSIPPELLRLLAPKGSLAVDGISLTVAELGRNRARFAIIPYTWRHTNLRWLAPKSAVNLETDPIARHVARLLDACRLV